MKIKRIDVLPIKFTSGDSFGGHGAVATGSSNYAVQPGWKGIYSSRIETLIVRIETDDGLVGWGEGQSPIAPEVAGTIVDKILAPVLVGRSPVATELLWRDMYELMSVRGHTGGFMLDAISAVDIALWDLKGKALGASIQELLGGPGRNSIPCYVSGLRGATDADRTNDLQSFVARGFRDFKFFGGFGRAEDVKTIEALLNSANDTVGMAFDALWKYSREDALKLGRDLQALGCTWFEAPIDGEDLAGHIALAKDLDIPVAGGETRRTRKELWPWLHSGAFDLAQPDIGRCGITEGIKILDLADVLNVRTTLHCGIASPIMIAASLQVASARPAVAAMEYQPVVLEAANTLIKEPLICEAGRFGVPSGPGLGIEVKDASVKRLAEITAGNHPDERG